MFLIVFIIQKKEILVKEFYWRVKMRKEENTENIEKEDLCSKLQVHFIENTEAEKSEEDTASTDQISTDSSVKPEECSKRMNKNNSENDAQEARNESKRKHRHENITSQNAEAVEETFYKVTGEAEPERKSHPIRNVILGLLVLILVAGAAISYPIGKEYFQEKSVAGKDIEVTIKKGSTSKDVERFLRKRCCPL